MKDNDLDESKPFWDHLEDFRSTLIKSIFALVVCMLFTTPFAPKIIALLKESVSITGANPDTFLIQLEVTGGLTVALKVIFWTGLILAFPCISFFMTHFIFPGLKHQEKEIVLSSFGAAAILFILGVLLGYTCTLGLALNFMMMVSAWIGVPLLHVLLTDYISFVLKLLLAFGVAFELPLILYILGRFGLVESSWLKSKRRHFFVGILIGSMFLTPQDPFTMLIMALPLYALFEGALYFIAHAEKKKPGL